MGFTRLPQTWIFASRSFALGDFSRPRKNAWRSVNRPPAQRLISIHRPLFHHISNYRLHAVSNVKLHLPSRVRFSYTRRLDNDARRSLSQRVVGADSTDRYNSFTAERCRNRICLHKLTDLDHSAGVTISVRLHVKRSSRGYSNVSRTTTSLGGDTK